MKAVSVPAQWSAIGKSGLEALRKPEFQKSRTPSFPVHTHSHIPLGNPPDTAHSPSAPESSRQILGRAWVGVLASQLFQAEKIEHPSSGHCPTPLTERTNPKITVVLGSNQVPSQIE